MASPPKLEERQLVEGFLRGDDAAHKTINGWIDVVLHDAFLSLRADWEDLRQEVRVRLYRNLSGDHFDGRSALRTYIHSIVRNVCIDSSRLAYRRRETTSTPEHRDQVEGLEGAPASVVIHRDLLAKILRDVSDEDRVLIRLVVLEHYSYAEVAERLGVSQSAIKGRVARCKTRLLEGYDRLTRTGGVGE